MHDPCITVQPAAPRRLIENLARSFKPCARLRVQEHCGQRIEGAGSKNDELQVFEDERLPGTPGFTAGDEVMSAWTRDRAMPDWVAMNVRVRDTATNRVGVIHGIGEAVRQSDDPPPSCVWLLPPG